jgi:uncharacterized protein YjbI with pentapeptide repeats
MALARGADLRGAAFRETAFRDAAFGLADFRLAPFRGAAAAFLRAARGGRFDFAMAGRCAFFPRFGAARRPTARFLVRLRAADARDAVEVAFFRFGALRLAM